MAEAPHFFLSYAHAPRYDGGSLCGRTTADPDVWVATLFADLRRQVNSLARLPSEVRTGCMAREQWLGHGWRTGLAQALGGSRVFVPLYSRRYFHSEHCGKEWTAFARRARGHEGRGAGRPPAIVPALWAPVEPEELPSAARSVSVDHTVLGERYAQLGFYGIMKLTRYRGEYERAVTGLARRIIDAARCAPADPDPELDYEALPNAFCPSIGETPGSQRLRITVVAPRQGELPDDRSPYYYGATARDWAPYRPRSSRALADHVADLARGLGYRPDVGDLDEHGAGLLDAGPPFAPQVLIVDAWATRQYACRDLLRRLDAMSKPWVQVLVAWNRQDRENAAAEAELRDALESALRHKLAEGRATSAPAVRGVPTLEEFSRVLPGVIMAAARQYIKHVEPGPAESYHRPRPAIADRAGLGWSASSEVTRVKQDTA